MTPPKERRIEIDVRKSDITVAQVEAAILIIRKMNPEREVFLDGDLWAIVSQVKE